jgi:inner membrane protein
MDIVTHGLVGVLAVRAFRSRTSWPVVAVAVGGALAPDLDGVAGLWDPMAPITVHRTMTHSLIGGLPLAAGVAAVTKLWSHTPSFPALAGFAYLGVLSHIGLDLLNPFGTAVLWPFASRRFRLGWLYVLDPAITGLVALALVLSWWSTAYRNAVPRWAFGMMAAYALVAGVLGRVGETQWRALLADRGVAASRVAVVPTFPGPLRWVGLAEAERALYRTAFWVGRPSNPTVTTFPKGATDGLAGLDRTAAVRTFLAFARFPWLSVTTDGDLRRVEYWDLAFQDHPLGGPMVLRIIVDRSGVVQGVDLGHML